MYCLCRDVIFKQTTAYYVRIRDWSSDVCSSDLLIRLDMAGIAVSAGSACSSGSMKPSHVLAAMGWRDPALREVIRISFGRTTSEEDVARVIAVWRQVSRETREAVA